MREAEASAICRAYKMSFIEDELPCLTAEIRRRITKLAKKKAKTGLDESDKFEWFNDFGTHALMSAISGGKIVLKAQYNLNLV